MLQILMLIAIVGFGLTLFLLFGGLLIWSCKEIFYEIVREKNYIFIPFIPALLSGWVGLFVLLWFAIKLFSTIEI